jgi:hypothetical protein
LIKSSLNKEFNIAAFKEFASSSTASLSSDDSMKTLALEI